MLFSSYRGISSSIEYDVILDDPAGTVVTLVSGVIVGGKTNCDIEVVHDLLPGILMTVTCVAGVWVAVLPVGGIIYGLL